MSALYVAPCRTFSGDWCSVCAEPDPHGDGRPAASEEWEGTEVIGELAYAPDPDCSTCRALMRCVCTPVHSGATR